MIGSLSREAKSIYFGEQTFQEFFGFFENQIRPEVHQAFRRATASFEPRKSFGVAERSAFSFGEGRQIKPSRKISVRRKAKRFANHSAIKKREGVSQSAVPKEGILSDTDKSQESKNLLKACLIVPHRIALLGRNERIDDRERDTANDIKEEGRYPSRKRTPRQGSELFVKKRTSSSIPSIACFILGIIRSMI